MFLDIIETGGSAALGGFIDQGHKTFKAIKYAPFPVVGAASGLALGGGCELLLHCDAIQAHAELSIGLVETRIGAIPGWGGCKEMMIRLSSSAAALHGPVAPAIAVFNLIAPAKVSASAFEARNLGFLRASDDITMNRSRLIADAKARAMALVEGYVAPEPPVISMAGPSGASTLGNMLDGEALAGRATAHDRAIGLALAGVLTGGPSADPLKPLIEEQVIALERQAFIESQRRQRSIASSTCWRPASRCATEPKARNLMAGYIPPVDDVTFLLGEVFDFDAQMAALAGCEEVNTELATSILEEGGKFCAELLEPLNRSGDEEGCRLENGLVSPPRGIADAYKAFVEAGWGGLSGDLEFGGQGLPRVLQILLDEMLSSANLSFGLFPGLTRGAVEAIAHHTSDELKQKYLPKMISGEWTGAMALTESAAGTDLGLLTSRAEPVGDGSYAIKGTKIFISSGDQDFGGNIVHLVLARLPDAPKGVKGISLFLSPKFLVNKDGSLGERNRMSVGSLEHKMGIHAQPTCVMNYDGAIGWLVGEPGRGLNAMFTMMNAERLFVGIQGLGIGEAANQKAVAYARERLQGRSADGARGPVAIIDHADVRKMLLTGRALTDAGRALAVWTAMQMDTADRHPDAAVRRKADGFVALLTPVVKAAFTDFGFEIAVMSQQVFGGHGYIREWGMEQYVRDARITQIYEGTNGVQAMDLVGRKLPMENGDVARSFFALVRDELAATAGPAELVAVKTAVGHALVRLEKLTEDLLAKGGDPVEAGASATDYLRFFALVSFGWLWVRMASKAAVAADATTPLKQRKLVLARFFAARLLPQTAALDTAIRAGASDIMALDADMF